MCIRDSSKPAITSSESKPVTVNGGTYDVANAAQIEQLLSYIPEDGTATLRLTEIPVSYTHLSMVLRTKSILNAFESVMYMRPPAGA